MDFDNDGQSDYLDIDSDNDGLSDAVEAGLNDADADGSVDEFSDSNADGLDDTTAATPATFVDTDGDTQPDWLDLDSDNDGLSDASEASGPGGSVTDADGDGVIDGFTDTNGCLLYTSPSPRDRQKSRMPSSA